METGNYHDIPQLCLSSLLNQFLKKNLLFRTVIVKDRSYWKLVHHLCFIKYSVSEGKRIVSCKAFVLNKAFMWLHFLQVIRDKVIML